MRRRLSVLMVIALIVAACSQDRAEMVQDMPAETEAPPQADMPSRQVGGVAGAAQSVRLIEYAIHMPQTLTAGRHSFRVENGWKEIHSFEIEGNGVHAVLPSPLSRAGTTTLEVNLPPGTYTAYCPIKGHRERGMETKITVNR